MKNNFHLDISSNLDYEGMVVDIMYKHDILATLNQDKGIDKIEIIIFSPTHSDNWSFSYEEFLQILQKAKETLIKANET